MKTTFELRIGSGNIISRTVPREDAEKLVAAVMTISRDAQPTLPSDPTAELVLVSHGTTVFQSRVQTNFADRITGVFQSTKVSDRPAAASPANPTRGLRWVRLRIGNTACHDREITDTPASIDGFVGAFREFIGELGGAFSQSGVHYRSDWLGAHLMVYSGNSGGDGTDAMFNPVLCAYIPPSKVEEVVKAFGSAPSKTLPVPSTIKPVDGKPVRRAFTTA